MDDKDWVMMVTLKQCPSISSAAEKLYVSQPALSKRIHGLEDEFQTSLITRTKYGIKLTQSGERLYNYSAFMLEQLKQIKSEILEMREDRIGTAVMFSQFIMPPLINNFTSIYPDIYPSVRTGMSTNLFNLLKQREIQMAFIRGEYSINGFEQHLISQDPICVVSKSPVDIEKLPDYPRIEYDTEPSLIQQIDGWIAEWFPNKRIHTSMRVGDSQTCINVISQVGGYAILPYYVLSPKDYPNLCINFLRNKDDSIVTRSTWFIYNRKEYEQLDSVKLFVNFIKQYFPENFDI